MRPADEGDVDTAGGGRPAASAAATCSGLQLPPPTRASPSSPNRPARIGPAASARPGDPDRHPWLLHARHGRRPAAGTRHRLAGEHQREQLDTSVERGAARSVITSRLGERRVLAVRVDTEAEAENHPPRTGDRATSSTGPRAVAAAGRHHRFDPHTGRGGSDRCQRDEGVGERHRRAVPQVVPHEHAVPPGLLRCRCDLGDQSGVGELDRERQRQSPTHERRP